jgi:RNA-directed DNA polymerase
LQEGQYEITVPTLADRVVQASLKAVLEPIFEADFKGSSAVPVGDLIMIS